MLVRVWDASNGELVTELQQPFNVQRSVFVPRVSPQSGEPEAPILITLPSSGLPVAWDLTTWKELPGYFPAEINDATCIAYSRSSKRFATGHGTGRIRLWHADGLTRCETRDMRHRFIVTDVKFSPDGKLLASCSADGYVLLWDTETGEPVTTLFPFEAVAP
jgi:WD40 repeat protein